MPSGGPGVTRSHALRNEPSGQVRVMRSEPLTPPGNCKQTDDGAGASDHAVASVPVAVSRRSPTAAGRVRPATSIMIPLMPLL